MVAVNLSLPLMKAPGRVGVDRQDCLAKFQCLSQRGLRRLLLISFGRAPVESIHGHAPSPFNCRTWRVPVKKEKKNKKQKVQ